MTREVYEWWCENHPESLTPINATKAWVLLCQMVASMRGDL